MPWPLSKKRLVHIPLLKHRCRMMATSINIFQRSYFGKKGHVKLEPKKDHDEAFDRLPQLFQTSQSRKTFGMQSMCGGKVLLEMLPGWARGCL